MFKISSENELLECFRPIDRPEVIAPQDLQYPIFVKDYLTWIEPSGCRIYLVVSDRLATPPLGITFRRDQSPGVASAMCEWCQSVRPGDGVGLLSATASSKRRIGIQLCRDLSCKDQLAARVGPMDPRKVLRRMVGFARRELF
jgi:hypothetical protein